MGESYTGVQKAAILLITLGPEKAASIFKHLKEDEIEELTLEIANTRSVSPQTKEEILDEEHDNHAEIDVEKQRDAWLKIGKEEAATWDELTVKQNTFKKQLFLSGNIKILDALEDMVFDIEIA